MLGRKNNNNQGRLPAGFIALIAMTVTACAQAQSVPPGDDAVEAIWRIRELPFQFHSANVSYTCDALRKKIHAILKAVGVHESLAVDMDCGRRTMVKFAQARISLASPVEATVENILAATHFEPHRVLAARMNDVALPTPTDIERFAASWRQAPLARLNLTSSDCDLLNGLRAQIFPMLRVRSLKGFLCSVSATRVPPNLGAEALMPTLDTESIPTAARR